MAVPQQKMREIIFQLLFSYDLGASDQEVMVPMLMKELSASKKTVYEAWAKMETIWQERSELDRCIAGVVKEYEVERIQKAERNILRLAIYELLNDKTVPPKVAISEGMRLARKFASPEAAHFVNALLDAIYKSCCLNETLV